MAPVDLARALRDEIVRLLREEIEEQAAALPASAEAIDEDGAVKVMVIDAEANCYRVTVELI
jgi:hypothetical protein